MVGTDAPSTRAARQTRIRTPCMATTAASSTASVVAIAASPLSSTVPSINRPASSAVSAPASASAHHSVAQLAAIPPSSEGSR